MLYVIARTHCLSYAEHRTYSEIELHSRMLRTIPRYVPNLTRLGLYEFIYMSPDDIEDIATALRALESLTLTGVRHALYILHISMLTRLYRVVSCRVVWHGPPHSCIGIDSGTTARSARVGYPGRGCLAGAASRAVRAAHAQPRLALNQHRARHGHIH